MSPVAGGDAGRHPRPLYQLTELGKGISLSTPVIMGAQYMKTLVKIWDHLEEYILVPSLMISTALIFYQVVMRFLFKDAPSWSEEAVRYLYVWQTWLGVSYAARNGTHLRITMIKDRLSPKGQKILELFVTAIWIRLRCLCLYSRHGRSPDDCRFWAEIYCPAYSHADLLRLPFLSEWCS